MTATMTMPSASVRDAIEWLKATQALNPDELPDDVRITLIALAEDLVMRLNCSLIYRPIGCFEPDLVEERAS